VDKDGNYIVADTKNNRIQKCTPNGDSSDCYAAVGGGGRGKGKDQLYQPYGVVVAPNGVYFVTDTRNNRVQKCQPGTPLKPGQCETVGGAGGRGGGQDQMNRPVGVVIASLR